MAVGLQFHPPGVVHPQHQYHPSQPLYIQDIPLQEVPNGHDMGPTAGQLEEEGNGVESSEEWAEYSLRREDE
ncbi:hypothetical protein KUCAC02_005058 [Chaenocephalus aceratus]|uniref:Uncharacterized protein n=1 Tax=Chaenocephalus aceratus TaxID=36190 RepID=A0ACB9WNU8_CHAAC|nr:hypothetical protein KUCAC02_005058 [Chaenocephalus aceratus]